MAPERCLRCPLYNQYNRCPKVRYRLRCGPGLSVLPIFSALSLKPKTLYTVVGSGSLFLTALFKHRAGKESQEILAGSLRSPFDVSSGPVSALGGGKPQSSRSGDCSFGPCLPILERKYVGKRRMSLRHRFQPPKRRVRPSHVQDESGRRRKLFTDPEHCWICCLGLRDLEENLSALHSAEHQTTHRTTSIHRNRPRASERTTRVPVGPEVDAIDGPRTRRAGHAAARANVVSV